MNSATLNPGRRDLAALLTVFIVALNPLILEAQSVGIDQSCAFVVNENGAKFVSWHGKPGRTYFIQISDPSDHLAKWNYAPLIESGNDEPISFQVEGIAEKGFFRLHFTDQALP